MIAKVLFVLGVVSIVYGATRWQTIEQVTSKSVEAVEQYSKAQQSSSVSTNDSKSYSGTGWDYPKEMRQLRLRITFAGGMYHGLPEFICFGAFGLALISVAYYLAQRKNDAA